MSSCDDVCMCGHTRDEHERTFCEPCSVCGCLAFEIDWDVVQRREDFREEE